MTLYDTLTKEYYVHMDFDPRVERFLVSCFVKCREGIYYYSGSYGVEPHISEVVKETKRYRCISERPFVLGRSELDGSISAPVFYLLHAFCESQGRDMQTLYNQVYGKDTLTTYEVEMCLSVAVWQGVEPVEIWTEAKVRALSQYLMHIHHTALAEVLVKQTLPHVIV